MAGPKTAEELIRDENFRQFREALETAVHAHEHGDLQPHDSLPGDEFTRIDAAFKELRQYLGPRRK